MEAIICDVADDKEIQRFEKAYNDQLKIGPVSEKTQFEYGWCLVRSPYAKHNNHGITLLEELFRKSTDDTAKRDYLFYMAVGNVKLKEYEKALKYAKAIQQVQPGNHQALELQKYIEKKMKRDGLLGMAAIGGAAAVAAGGIALLGIALSKK